MFCRKQIAGYTTIKRLLTISVLIYPHEELSRKRHSGKCQSTSPRVKNYELQSCERKRYSATGVEFFFLYSFLCVSLLNSQFIDVITEDWIREISQIALCGLALLSFSYTRDVYIHLKSRNCYTFIIIKRFVLYCLFYTAWTTRLRNNNKSPRCKYMINARVQPCARMLIIFTEF